ncbi:unnamed protein product [Cuscuta campestris]|uniref:Late embryogenesis abundant protein LEA-2 subgroup domain-containing protein n=1 Tax=Cuscuta campestris TaxID=132261 RepID=A0A484NFS2_9ASTE|nr:unnamed protein product [Cuscuta campestris]
MAADHQKIHPVHVELENTPKPTAPLVPPGSFRSEKGNPETQHVVSVQPPYPQPPPPPPPAAVIRKRRSCCRRCLCWTCCSLLLAVLAVAVSAAVLFLVFRPKLPKYSVDSLTISQLSLSPDNNTLSAAFRVSITARNPNKKIGIYYRSGSRLRVAYAGTDLCEGPFPEFYQGHRNTTVVNVALTGQTTDASGLLRSMQTQQQTEGIVPLDLRAKVPVRVKIGKLKMMKWKFLVKCRVGVDSLSQVNVIRVRSSKCKFRFRL